MKQLNNNLIDFTFKIVLKKKTIFYLYKNEKFNKHNKSWNWIFT